MTTNSVSGTRGRMGRAAAFAAAALLVGCNVTNPGQILDSDLNNTAAMPILVTGMAGDFELGLRDVGWNNAVLVGDLSGTSAYLSRQRHWAGHPEPEDADEYNTTYRALWVAESGLERMKTVLGADFDKSRFAAEAYMWAGFSSRLLGETMCQAVFDGGPALPRMAYFAHADSAFTNAIRIAEAAGTTAATVRLASYGGRASVRLVRGDWAGALSDAAVVPTAFEYLSRFSTVSLREQNQIFAENRVRVNLSVKYTWFEKYAADYADPRTVVGKDPKLTISADGVSPHLIEGKYNDLGADVVLTRGTEMRLIEAENQIVNGDWPTGLAMVNAIRTTAGVIPFTATTRAEALDRLKLERAVVMWLESRRGGDLLRWSGPSNDPILAAMTAAAPGNMPLAGRAICSPFSQTLMSTNPNLQGTP